MQNSHVFARAFNTPLMVDLAKAQAFVTGFGNRLFGDQPEIVGGAEVLPESVYRTAKPFASLLDGSLADSVRGRDWRGYHIREGVAVVPVTGVLVHRGSYIGKSSGQTSYEGIEAVLDVAAADHRVRAIALEFDSYGGEVAGCFGLARRIREIRAIMPVWAFVAEHAFSAAYALASQADQIVVPPTGGAGSIGVIVMHADFSGRLSEDGIRVTLITAGAHKGEGNPYQPLPKDVRARLSAEMEELRGMFAETVGAGRGSRLTASAALETEAATFMGRAALAAGLVDQVEDPRIAFDRFVQDISGGKRLTGLATRVAASTQERSEDMLNPDAETDDLETGAAATTAVSDDASDDDTEAQAVEDAGEGDSRADTETDAPNPVGERARISAILNAPEAEGRTALARHLALETDHAPAAAKAILAKAGKDGAGGKLARAMSGDDTDLDSPAANAPQGPTVAGAVKKRFAQ